MYFLNPNIFKSVTIFYGCTALFLSDLVGNPEDRVLHDTAQMIPYFAGNPDRGWNDPPMFNYSSRPVQQPSTPKRLLNKRVAFPATNLPPPGHAGEFLSISFELLFKRSDQL